MPIERQTQPCTTCIWAVHDPLFAAHSDADPLESSITVRSTTEAGGFESLVLYLTIGEIVPCESLRPATAPSAEPCSDNATQQQIDCLDDPSASSVECHYDIVLSQTSIVTYQAVAIDMTGMSKATPAITFAYGQPPGGEARPIWWHGADAGSAATPDRLELGFFPDSDYLIRNKTYADFATHVNEIVGRAFFNDDETFAEQYTANRHLFDLWAAPFGATAPFDCAEAYDFDLATQPVRQLADAGIVVHDRSYPDCSHIEDPPGDSTVYGRTTNNGWLLVHESGHFLMGLGDEYERPAHMACSIPPNVYVSEQDCQNVAVQTGADKYACVPFEESGMWRIDEPEGEDGFLEVMDNEGGQRKSSTFQSSSGDALNGLIGRCLAGNCYQLSHVCVGPAPALPSPRQ